MSLTVTFSSIIAMIRLRPLSYTDTDLFILLCTLDNKDSLLNIRSVPSHIALLPDKSDQVQVDKGGETFQPQL